MAIDTPTKRASAIGVCAPYITLVIPDGSIDLEDRLAIAQTYSGIDPAPENIVVVEGITPTAAMTNYLRSLGFVGAPGDLVMQWFDSLGVSDAAIDDRWKEWLDINSIPDGGMDTRLVHYYEKSLGIPIGTSESAINVLERAFWLNQ